MDRDETKNLSNTDSEDYTHLIFECLRYLQKRSEFKHGHSASEILEVVRERFPSVNFEEVQSQIADILYSALNDSSNSQLPPSNCLFVLNLNAASTRSRFQNNTLSFSHQASKPETTGCNAEDTFYCDGCTHTPRCRPTLPPFLREFHIVDSSGKDLSSEERRSTASCISNIHPVVPRKEPRDGGLTVDGSKPEQSQQPSSLSIFQCPCQKCSRLRQQPSPEKIAAPCTNCTCATQCTLLRHSPPRVQQGIGNSERTASCAEYVCTQSHPCGRKMCVYTNSSEPAESSRRRPRPHTPQNSSDGNATSACSSAKRTKSSSLPEANSTERSESSPRVEIKPPPSTPPANRPTTCTKRHSTNVKCLKHSQSRGECVII